MEKLKQVQQLDNNFDKYFKDCLIELEQKDFCKKSELPNEPGIYVFYKSGKPVYVGRSDKIKSRVNLHARPSSMHGSATFAFILARRRYFEEHRGNLSLSRSELEKIPEFAEVFSKFKEEINTYKFKFLLIENDILQTMVEPYLAFKLCTYPENNTFENH